MASFFDSCFDANCSKPTATNGQNQGKYILFKSHSSSFWHSCTSQTRKLYFMSRQEPFSHYTEDNLILNYFLVVCVELKTAPSTISSIMHF